MARRNTSEPLRDGDTGLMAFRYPDEPLDGRPVLLWSQFWSDESERMAYEQAVNEHPKRGDEGAFSYLARISAIVTGSYQRVGLNMPRRMSQAEWTRRQNEAKAKDWRQMGEW